MPCRANHTKRTYRDIFPPEVASTIERHAQRYEELMREKFEPFMKEINVHAEVYTFESSAEALEEE